MKAKNSRGVANGRQTSAARRGKSIIQLIRRKLSQLTECCYCCLFAGDERKHSKTNKVLFNSTYDVLIELPNSPIYGYNFRTCPSSTNR